MVAGDGSHLEVAGNLSQQFYLRQKHCISNYCCYILAIYNIPSSQLFFFCRTAGG